MSVPNNFFPPLPPGHIPPEELIAAILNARKFRPTGTLEHRERWLNRLPYERLLVLYDEATAS